MNNLDEIINMPRDKKTSYIDATLEHLKFALQSANVGVWCWDILHNIIKDISGAGVLYGFTPGVDTNFIEFLTIIHHEDRELLNTKFNQALTDEENGYFQCEYRIIFSDKSVKYISACGRAYFDEQGNPEYMIGVSWDITEKRETELRLRQLQIELSHAARANAISEMATTLAHELNQPLTTISTYAQLYLSQIAEEKYYDVELLAALEQIAKQSERAGAIIHRIKEFAQQGVLYTEIVDVNHAVQEAIEFIYYEKTNLLPKIQFELDDSLPLLRIDKIQIQQVVINLVRNSIEAIQNASIFNAKVVISTSLTKNNHVEVSITDNGPGVPVKVRDYLFKSYITTKRTGMGIGLTICRRIIEAHGGTLDYISGQNIAGACFKFTLPIKE